MANSQDPEEKFRIIYSGLNPEQKLAVDTIDGPVIVIAGPGTGKTQILSARIGKILLETDTAPQNILCMTYTEAGVIAMRKRLISFMGSDAYKVQVHTFHSFSNMVVQENARYFSKKDMDALSDLERIEVLQKLIDGFDSENSLKRFRGEIYYDMNFLASLFSNIKRENWNEETLRQQIDEYIQDIIPETDGFYNKRKRAKGEFELTQKGKDEVERMKKTKDAILSFKQYQEILREKKRYDYDDMINWTIWLFENFSDILLSYQERFQYILVDEYQDTSGSQNKIVSLLTGFWQDERPNIFVVGDDDQSIYKFQGANLQNLQSFVKTYDKDLVKIVLSKNYRSVQPILDAAKNLIENNRERLINHLPGLSKELISANKDLQGLAIHPVIRIYNNPFEENAHIVLSLKKLIEEGVSPSEIAVIYREHQLGDGLIKFLQLLQIPFNARRSVNLLEDVFIKKILTICRYIVAEQDIPFSGEQYLFEILHYDFFGLNPFRIAVISHELSSSRKKSAKEKSFRAYLQDLKNENEQKLFPDKEEDILFIRIADILESLQGKINNNSLLSWFELMINETGILSYILSHSDKFWLMKKLTVLFDFIKDATHRNPDMHLKALIEQVDLMIQNNLRIDFVQQSGTAAGVSLLTAHGSKGLEFDYVFLMCCRTDIWEGKRDMNKGFKLPPKVVGQESAIEKTEESRRLFFVSMTRAKKHLYISYPEYQNDGKPILPSQFIAETKIQDMVPEERIVLTEDEKLQFATLRFGIIQKPVLETNEKEYINQLLEKFTMNVSALNNFLECPLKFYYTSLIRVPSIKSESMQFGNCIHSAFNDFFIKMMKDGQVYPSKEFLLKQFEKDLYNNREVFTSKSLPNFLEYGFKILEKYYDYFYIPPPVHDFIQTEYSLKNVIIQNVPLRGFADKIQFWKNDIIITDFKTGKYSSAKSRGEFDVPGSAKAPLGGNYWRQAVFYKLLSENLPGKNWHVMHIQFEFLEMNKKEIIDIEKLIITQDQTDAVIAQITESWEKIQKHEFYQGCGKPDCHWCNFIKDHKLYHSLIEEETEDLPQDI